MPRSPSFRVPFEDISGCWSSQNGSSKVQQSTSSVPNWGGCSSSFNDFWSLIGSKNPFWPVCESLLTARAMPGLSEWRSHRGRPADTCRSISRAEAIQNDEQTSVTHPSLRRVPSTLYLWFTLRMSYGWRASKWRPLCPVGRWLTSSQRRSCRGL